MDEESIGLVNCGECNVELLGERTAAVFAQSFTPDWVDVKPVEGRIWVGVRRMPLCKNCLTTATRRKWKESHASRHICHAKSDEDSPWQANNIRTLEG